MSNHKQETVRPPSVFACQRRRGGQSLKLPLCLTLDAGIKEMNQGHCQRAEKLCLCFCPKYASITNETSDPDFC